MSRQKYLSDTDIQEIAARSRHEYEQKVGQVLPVGISAEDAAFRLLGVDVDWASFEDEDTLGKTIPPTFGKPARLVLNQDHLNFLFREVPNLENTTIAHELGHLILHVDHGKTKQMTLDLDTVEQIAVPTKVSFDPQRLPNSEYEWREWQAHTFMRHFLVPPLILQNHVGDKTLSGWLDVTMLAEHFRVTKKVMQIQLEKLKIIPRGTLIDRFTKRGNQ